MIFIATLFRKLQIVKDLVRPPSKKHRFRTPLSEHPNSSKGSMREPLSYFSITLTQPGLESLSLSYMLILMGVS